ncbi:hypothetical protein ABDK96_16485 [Citricoccus nitrophenolicus]|uniref:Uncharacterized protein n=1 Tax=Citricoccus nitrophenolicus TaxID=863575 RepID=A0ABV0IP06_9MICC|nr:hypothetical protein [Citricoccus sp. I39-566]NUL48632.1 hypothetical protein [Cellulosimicrobium funkei]WMY77513.1 hypothetical protein RE421_11760 [Citricoccus sp. I39-566]
MAEPERRPRPADVPPTAVRLLPVLVVTFGLSMLIDMTTDWHFLLRWALALGGGLLAQVVVLRIWTSRQR